MFLNIMSNMHVTPHSKLGIIEQHTKVEHESWCSPIQLHPHVLPFAACSQQLPPRQHLLQLVWSYALYHLCKTSQTDQ